MKLKVVGSNQTEIEMALGVVVFFSYNTPVAAFLPGTGYLRTSKKWSVTTSKHINQWLSKKKAATIETVDQAVLDNLV